MPDRAPLSASTRVARVFPRRTNATPRDPLAFSPRPGRGYTDAAPGMFPPEVHGVYVSAAFTWDLPGAEWLAKAWARVAPVTIGGPATGMRGEAFTPGMFLREGYVITSRGCPGKYAADGKWRCAHFCSVRKRDGAVVRELPITEGYNVLDDNFLACSQAHILAACDMLRRQKGQPQFTGGIDAARLEPWSAEALRSIRTKQLFLAYDTPDDWESLVRAANLLWSAGFTKASHAVRCYVLCGWPRDTMEAADVRMRRVLALGVVPMAMLWRDNSGKRDPAWVHFAKIWARPASVCAAGRAA